jgi:hypothetical protein
MILQLHVSILTKRSCRTPFTKDVVFALFSFLKMLRKTSVARLGQAGPEKSDQDGFFAAKS